jgi:hypothetical protein
LTGAAGTADVDTVAPLGFTVAWLPVCAKHALARRIGIGWRMVGTEEQALDRALDRVHNQGGREGESGGVAKRADEGHATEYFATHTS